MAANQFIIIYAQQMFEQGLCPVLWLLGLTCFTSQYLKLEFHKDIRMPDPAA